MTYATDIAKRTHNVGYYVAFDGIPTRLATHDMGDYGVSGTFLAALTGPPTGGSLRLDRRRSLVLPDGFSVEAMDTASVRALLCRRGGTEARLGTAITTSSVDVGFGTNVFSGVSTIYLDRETITLGAYNALSGEYEGCTRAAYSSIAAPHFSGALASSVPRYWWGRRARLYAVNLDTGTEQAIRTAVLSQSPVFKNGVWQLSFIDLQRELRREICTGWQPERVTGRTIGTTSVVLDVPNAANFIDGATYPAHVRVSYADHFEVWELTSGDVDTGNDQITLRYLNFVQSTAGEFSGLPQLADDADVTIQQVLWFVQDPAVAALMLLLSTTGFGLNDATYDVLPGRTPTADTGSPRARMGAGIPAAWVDISSFTDEKGREPLVVYVEEPEMVLDYLANEILWRLGGYLYVNGDGQLAFQKYRAAVPQTADDIDKSDIKLAEVTTVDDESEILAAATWRLNYDHTARDYLRTVQAAWIDTAPIYGEDLPTLDMESRTAWVGVASPSRLASAPFGNELQLVTQLDRLYSRTRLGVRRTKLVLPWTKHADYVPGKLFKLTDDRLPDGEGSLGVTSRWHEVVSTSTDYQEGTVTVEAEELPPGFLVAPAAFVLSVVLPPPGAPVLWLNSRNLDGSDNATLSDLDEVASPSQLGSAAPSTWTSSGDQHVYREGSGRPYLEGQSGLGALTAAAGGLAAPFDVWIYLRTGELSTGTGAPAGAHLESTGWQLYSGWGGDNWGLYRNFGADNVVVSGSSVELTDQMVGATYLAGAGNSVANVDGTTASAALSAGGALDTVTLRAYSDTATKARIYQVLVYQGGSSPSQADVLAWFASDG